MKVRRHSKQQKNRASAAIVAVLACATCSMQGVLAQGLANGSYASQPSADQDSLLPPEVVPLDPTAASNLSAVEAAKRQAQAMNGSGTPGTNGGAPTQAFVPGLVAPQAPGSGPMMSAQQMRSAAYNSLYNQNNVPPQWQQQNGSVSFNNQPPINPALTAPYPAAMANTQPPQSQTLSGGAPTYPTQNITRGGLTNTVSGVAGLATAGLMANYLIRPSSAGSAMMGLGMFGLMMTGFGARNGFRL